MKTFTTHSPIGTCPRITAGDAAELIERELHKDGSSLQAFGYDPDSTNGIHSAASLFAGDLDSLATGESIHLGKYEAERIA